MSYVDRRLTLRMMAVAALSGGVGLLPARAIAGERLLEPPSGPMRYSRRIITDMQDGSIYSVFRAFRTTFARFADGFLIEGEQIDVQVEAPQALQEFAELESARVERGLFPMVIDPFGLLQSEQYGAIDSELLGKGADLARERIARSPLPDEEREMVNNVVTSIDTATMRFTAHLPIDIFCPPLQERLHEELVELTDGSAGSVSTRFAGTRNPSTGLMENAFREVTTAIGDDRRRVREEWELKPL